MINSSITGNNNPGSYTSSVNKQYAYYQFILPVGQNVVRTVERLYEVRLKCSDEDPVSVQCALDDIVSKKKKNKSLFTSTSFLAFLSFPSYLDRGVLAHPMCLSFVPFGNNFTSLIFFLFVLTIMWIISNISIWKRENDGQSTHGVQSFKGEP